MTPDGTLYRIDLRLRPEGDAGPLTRSVASYENYYAQWGQTWERMMLIKARGVAGDPVLAAEFIEMIQPFRYPRSVNESVLREVAAMKDRIENEVVKAGELERNVKLGEAAFGRSNSSSNPCNYCMPATSRSSRARKPCPAWPSSSNTNCCSGRGRGLLAEAYCFLRNVEHRLQMEDNLQTHTIPADRPALDRLARLMGFASLEGSRRPADATRTTCAASSTACSKADAAKAKLGSPFPRQFEGAESGVEKTAGQPRFQGRG